MHHVKAILQYLKSVPERTLQLRMHLLFWSRASTLQRCRASFVISVACLFPLLFSLLVSSLLKLSFFGLEHSRGVTHAFSPTESGGRKAIILHFSIANQLHRVLIKFLITMALTSKQSTAAYLFPAAKNTQLTHGMYLICSRTFFFCTFRAMRMVSVLYMYF